MRVQKAHRSARGPILVQRCAPEALHATVHEIKESVARRAYELFEERQGMPGHDQEDWFRAETETVRPVSIVVSESADRVLVYANVLGFGEEELRLAIEPLHVMIYGKKALTFTETEGGKIEYIDWMPDQICRVVALPCEIDPNAAIVTLQGGMLKFDLRKARLARRRGLREGSARGETTRT